MSIIGTRLTTSSEDEFNKLADETRKYLPGPTCGRINSVVEHMDSAQKLCNRYGNYDDMARLVEDIEPHLDVHNDLETLRKENETLREFSQAWRDLAESFLQRLTDYELTSVPQLIASIEDAMGILDFEINPSNYTHDDACTLNSNSIEAYLLLEQARKDAKP